MKVVAASFTLEQESDSCSIDTVQYLKVRVTDAGGGPYIVLKTKRWALDREELPKFIEKLINCLDQVDPLVVPVPISELSPEESEEIPGENQF